jgi:hypothetical protein
MAKRHDRITRRNVAVVIRDELLRFDRIFQHLSGPLSPAN